MSLMYCEECCCIVDTNEMDHCQWGPDFKCENCVDREAEEKAEKLLKLWALQQQIRWWHQQDQDENFIQSASNV